MKHPERINYAVIKKKFQIFTNYKYKVHIHKNKTINTKYTYRA